MLENLIRGGFGYLKAAGENLAIYENKFTGLWLLVDFGKNTYTVLEN